MLGKYTSLTLPRIYRFLRSVFSVTVVLVYFVCIVLN